MESEYPELIEVDCDYQDCDHCDCNSWEECVECPCKACMCGNE